MGSLWWVVGVGGGVWGVREGSGRVTEGRVRLCLGLGAGTELVFGSGLGLNLRYVILFSYG